jgi:hypothetical protein
MQAENNAKLGKKKIQIRIFKKKVSLEIRPQKI